jgi:hypothetical protein
MTLAANTAQLVLVIFIGVIAVGGIIWAATRALHQRRRNVWDELARSRGLTFSDDTDGPRVSGSLEGRAVEVSVDDFSSDRDVGGVEVVRIAVELHGVPRAMSAEGVPGLIGDLAALAEERIHFEQEPFNHNVLVQGDESPARTYWTHRRQTTFLQLVETLPCDQVEIREARVIAELREIVSDRSRLEQILDRLMSAAPTLDASSTGGGE